MNDFAEYQIPAFVAASVAFSLVAKFIIRRGMDRLLDREKGDVFYWDWIGYVGSSSVLILTLSKVQWENQDWRAVVCGAAVTGGVSGLLAFAWLRLLAM